MKSLPEKSDQVKPEKKTKGFFLVPRDVSRLPFFDEKRITKKGALLYLIDHAVFKAQDIKLERKNCTIKIRVNRNEVFTSRLELKERWGRSLGWIDRFLLKLEEKKLIKVFAIETSLKTEKQVNNLGQLKIRKTGQLKTVKTRQLGIRVKLLFLNDLDEELKQKRVNKILEKQVNKKNEK